LVQSKQARFSGFVMRRSVERSVSPQRSRTGSNDPPKDAGRQGDSKSFYRVKNGHFLREIHSPEGNARFRACDSPESNGSPRAVCGGAFAPQFLLQNVRDSAGIPLQKTPHR
jgi:hypothetical protein